MATHAKPSSKVLRFFLKTAAYQFTMDESAESLLQSLRNPKALPFEAIKAATVDRERVAPLLIQELQKFAADFQGYDRNDCLPVIAIYLLAEWQVDISPKAIPKADDVTWTQLADAAFELNPAELMDEIRPLFRQGIIDPSMTSLAEFEREAKRDRAISMRQHADRFHPITDTAQSISYWGRWKDSSSLYHSSTGHTPPKSTPASVPARPAGSKTGRNEPCPFGSGKKYKKCCGRLPQ